MEAQPKRCRRCLLQDMADENDYYASVVRYRATMPRRVRTPDAEYTARLEHCRTCPSLNAGTCMQCGCYVEMRAAISAELGMCLRGACLRRALCLL